MTSRALPARRRLLTAVLLAVIAVWWVGGFGWVSEYTLGPGFCSPEEHAAVTR